MTETELLGGLLSIDRGWAVNSYQMSASRVDVWIAPRAAPARGWFGQSKRAPEIDAAEAVWRHTNLCCIPCYVHVRAPTPHALDGLPWAGGSDLPFSRAMGDRVFALLAEGVDYAAICNVLGISFADLWKYKVALDTGRARVSKQQPTTAGAAAVATPIPAAAAAAAVGFDADGVPDPADPVWQALIEGSVALNVRTLSLKLLLTRLRSQWAMLDDEEVKIAKIRELQRYFLKSAGVLGYELAQLRRLQ